MDWMSASNTAMSPIQTSMLLTTRPLRYRRMSHKCLHGRPQSFFQGRAKSEPRPEGPRWGEVLGEGVANPSHQLGVPAQIDLLTIFTYIDDH